MKTKAKIESREALALREVGHTRVTRSGAWGLALGFLLLIIGVPLHQYITEWRAARSAEPKAFAPTSLALFRQLPSVLIPLREQGLTIRALRETNRGLLAAMQAFEDELEDQSVLGIAVRPRLQTFMLHYLGVGTEQVYVGRDRWLFYRPGVDYVMGPGFLHANQLKRRAAGGNAWQPAPQPDPRSAILDFRQQLAERDIELVIVPTPVKPTIHPEQLTRRISFVLPPLQNVSYEQLLRELHDAGVHVFDPAGVLHARKLQTGGPQYLATDTHWRPEAMGAVAAALADYLEPLLPPAPTGITLQRQELEVAGMGDLALMLDVDLEQSLFARQAVTIQQVLQADGQYWRASRDAAVLFLGDSFSNIYSFEPMGWGESAGFVEQLGYYLGRSIDRMVRNDGGAFATREMLQRELARGVDRLAGKRVVVWQFAARELAVGDWRLLPLALQEPQVSHFLVPRDGEVLIVTGVVQDVSSVPRPGTVPYRDHIVSVHLADLPDGAEAVVYLRSMIDNQWTSAARLRSGQEVTVALQAWQTVADQYDAINRSELDRFELQLEEPCWGQIVE